VTSQAQSRSGSCWSMTIAVSVSGHPLVLLVQAFNSPDSSRGKGHLAAAYGCDCGTLGRRCNCRRIGAATGATSPRGGGSRAQMLRLSGAQRDTSLPPLPRGPMAVAWHVTTSKLCEISCSTAARATGTTDRFCLLLCVPCIVTAIRRHLHLPRTMPGTALCQPAQGHDVYEHTRHQCNRTVGSSFHYHYHFHAVLAKRA
jgi:hypothetical protein